MIKPNRTLLVFKYLWEHADDKHPVTIAELTDYLLEHGIVVKDYRTIQSDIANLKDIGVDITQVRSRSYEYSIGTRVFEIP